MGGCKGIKNRTLGVLDSNRDNHWHGLLQIYCAYAPDVDMIADPALKKIGVTVLVYGSPISHGDFHNIAVLLVYATLVALLLHPIGIRLEDSFFFACTGFAAHMFEDALVANPAHPFLLPLSYQRFGIGIFNYTRDWYGIADKEVLTLTLPILGNKSTEHEVLHAVFTNCTLVR